MDLNTEIFLEKIMSIRCIFLSEFHPIAGPIIRCQVPDEFVTKEFFDAIHIYIITKQELQSRLITVNVLGQKIIGCPVCIDNTKYARNALIFNLCFVFDASTQTCVYGSAVKKLASYLTQLELESGFLSDESKKDSIPVFLDKILTDLNQTGSCSMVMGESCTIHLKISPAIDDPRPVQDHDVPIILSSKPITNNQQWDLTTQQKENEYIVTLNFEADDSKMQTRIMALKELKVLQYIDGFNHVARIAVEADVEINLVKACLQNLLHFNVITIISIFQYSNVYTSTEKIRELVEDPVLQEECLQGVSTKVHVKPNFRDVLVLYSNMTAGMTVKDLCIRYNPHALKIDEKKLIQFGSKHKLIQRLHRFPLKLPDVNGRQYALQKWFTGIHSCDEICCKTGLSYQDLDEKIENDPSIVVCWK